MKHLKTDIPLPWTSHGHIWDTVLSPVRECSTTATSIVVADSSTRSLYFCISWRRSFLSSASFLRRRWRNLLLSRKTWSTEAEVFDRTLQQENNYSTKKLKSKAAVIEVCENYNVDWHGKQIFQCVTFWGESNTHTHFSWLPENNNCAFINLEWAVLNTFPFRSLER